MSDYNGWPNKATWLVSLWLTNESDDERALAEFVSTHEHLGPTEALDYVAEYIGGEGGTLAHDLMVYALCDVSWPTLIRHWNAAYRAEAAQ
jgi:hypothetical protein